MSEKWNSHAYQRCAASFVISNKHSGLFLDPGLGKTSISLLAIKIMKLSGMLGSKGTLIVAPLRVVHNVWPKEISKWLDFKGLTYTILHEDKGKASIWGPQKDIYLINPEGLKWLYSELLDGLQMGGVCPFNNLIVDESTKFKNHEAKARFLLLKDMLPLFRRTCIMTGTPTPKSLIDLWSQIFLLDQGKSLGSNFWEFRKTYFEQNDWNKYNWFLKDFSEEAIQDKIAHLVLDMSAEDHLDMPPLTFNDIYIDLPPKEMKYYKLMEKDYFIEIDDMEASADTIAVSAMKCHQIANGRVYEDIPEDLTEEEEKEFRKTRKTLFIHSAKIEAVKDLVEELNGKPILIAYHYKHDLAALQEAFPDAPYVGSRDSTDEELIAKWNRGEIPVLFGHPMRMAHGLNMQDVSTNIGFFSLTWNLEDYIQFFRRVWRQGVSGATVVHNFIARGTTDEAMLRRLGERAEGQENLRVALREYRRLLAKHG